MNERKNLKLNIRLNKIMFGAALLFLCTFLCGCSVSEVTDNILEIFNSRYITDAELEVAASTNVIEKDRLKALQALDICKAEYATQFTKKYFSEKEDIYVYKMKSQNLYLAAYQIVVLEEIEYYELVMFEINDESKNILSRYYVNSQTGELYDEADKPSETKVYTDNALGLKVYIPEIYEKNISMSYSDKEKVKVGEDEVDTRIITFNYTEDDVTNELFYMLVFEEIYPEDIFGITDDNSEAYFLGSNNKYTFCLQKAELKDNYLENAEAILLEDFNYILKNIKIY